MAILDFTDEGEPIVWQSTDGNLRVVARPDEHSYDYDFFGDLSEEDIARIQSQIDTFGMWIIALEEQDTDGDWEWMDNIGGVIPDDDYKLQDAAQEYFLLDKYKPLGLFNWNKQNYKTRFAETIPFTPQYFPYPWEEIELVDLDEETLREIFIEMLDDTGKTDALLRHWNGVSKLPQDKPDTITDIVMAHNKQELIDYILAEQPQTTKSFGLFNWNTHNYRTRFAETFAASRRKRKPLNQTGVFNWWDETALWALKYDWVKLILLENPEKSPYEVMRTTRNDTRKCPSCANRRSRRGGRENYGAMVEHRNDGVKKFNYDSCNCGIYDTSAKKRRQKEVKKEMLRRGLVGDMDKVHPDLRPAAAQWYLKKGDYQSNYIPHWFHREYSHPTLFERLRDKFRYGISFRRGGKSDWMVREREKYMSENFSAPFMDITFQDTPMQVKHLYHGQHTVDGVEITPHSPYWTTDLALALGHALFGAEQEVAGADLLICSKCDGTHLTSDGGMCYSCDEKGYVLQETFTDDILPQTTPLVLSLDFTEPHTVYFTQDMEHDAGVSYLVESENFRWNFVPAETLLALLYTWLDTGLPELVEFDTGAGYVENESSVTNRIQQAIHQLEQSAH